MPINRTKLLVPFLSRPLHNPCRASLRFQTQQLKTCCWLRSRVPPNTILDLEVGFPRLVSPWGRGWGRLSPDTAACQELDPVLWLVKSKGTITWRSTTVSLNASVPWPLLSVTLRQMSDPTIPRTLWAFLRWTVRGFRHSGDGNFRKAFCYK